MLLYLIGQTVSQGITEVKDRLSLSIVLEPVISVEVPYTRGAGETGALRANAYDRHS